MHEVFISLGLGFRVGIGIRARRAEGPVEDGAVELFCARDGDGGDVGPAGGAVGGGREVRV